VKARRPGFVTLARVHLTLTVVWTITVIPTMLWWRDSILWVAFLSVWANVASHWTGYQAARAEQAAGQAAGDG
jgi:hypothetical protein